MLLKKIARMEESRLDLIRNGFSSDMVKMVEIKIEILKKTREETSENLVKLDNFLDVGIGSDGYAVLDFEGEIKLVSKACLRQFATELLDMTDEDKQC